MNNKILFLLVICNILNLAQQNNNKTIVVPHPYIKLNDNKNVIYSASFHHAWKELQNNILNEEVKTQHPVRLVSVLNRNNPPYISVNNQLSMCGFAGAGICEKIQKKVNELFNQTVDLSPLNDDPFNIICYSYFKKKWSSTQNLKRWNNRSLSFIPADQIW